MPNSLISPSKQLTPLIFPFDIPLQQGYGGKDRLRAKTGLPLAPYFSASKLVYLLDTVPNLRADAEAGEALFGNIDTWLIWNLTQGQVHATDVTNASRTLMMNLHTLQWDPEITTELNVPVKMLPMIKPSSGLFGHITGTDGLEGVPIAGVLGDQQAALFGQSCFAVGDTKCTYGTKTLPDTRCYFSFSIYSFIHNPLISCRFGFLFIQVQEHLC